MVTNATHEKNLGFFNDFASSEQYHLIHSISSTFKNSIRNLYEQTIAILKSQPQFIQKNLDCVQRLIDNKVFWKKLGDGGQDTDALQQLERIEALQQLERMIKKPQNKNGFLPGTIYNYQQDGKVNLEYLRNVLEELSVKWTRNLETVTTRSQSW